jgi:hypothetical protein
MRTNNANRMIEEQIAREIAKLNTFMTDEDEKPAIIQRIAELKKLVDEPTQSPEKSTPPTARELISEFIAAFRLR